MAKKKSNLPTLNSDEYFRLRRAIREKIYEMENRDWSILVCYGGDKKAFDKARKEILAMRAALKSFGNLFEEQYKHLR
jgi:hypothetical protein